MTTPPRRSRRALAAWIASVFGAIGLTAALVVLVVTVLEGSSSGPDQETVSPQVEADGGDGSGAAPEPVHRDRPDNPDDEDPATDGRTAPDGSPPHEGPPPLDPIGLEDDALGGAIATAASLFPQIAAADRDQLGVLVVAACEAVQAADHEATATVDGVADEIVAAIPDSTEVNRYRAAATMVIGRYLHVSGCVQSDLARAVVQKLANRVSTHFHEI